MDNFLEIFLLILAFIISGYYIYEKKIIKKKKLKGKLLIPGLRKTNQSIGNLGDLKVHGSLHQFLTHLHSEYGKVASFYWMDTFVVSTCDHNSFKDTKHLFNRPKLIFSNFKPFIGDECIQFANGVEGQDRRKCYDRSFSQESVIRYIKTFAEAGNQEINKINSSKTRSVESVQLMCLTMAVKTILGCCLTPEKKDDYFITKVLSLYKTVFDGITERIIENQTFESTDKEEIKFQKAQKEFNSLIKDIVTSRIRFLEDENVNNSDQILIDDMIHFHGDVNLDLIVKEVLVYMIAGFHTSGNLFAWCLYYLAKRQDLQDRIFDEIVEHPFQFSNTTECFTAIASMPFLRACINETLRLSELASFAARLSNEDITIGPYIVPANTPIIQALGVSYNNPDIFKQPQDFDPNRFITETFPSLGFVPFGFAGKRKCPGEKFAYLEVSIWLIEFVEKYRFTLLHPDDEVKKSYGLVTQVDRPIPMVFTAR